jgi:2-polyprenyl-3-methyl-5-hydroxy-6-metoxy-1,4-benzoquinol methylase
MDEQYRDLAGQYAAKPDDYFGHFRPEILRFVPEGCKSVLEVGCGAGAFGESLKDARPDCEVWGIEPDAEAAKKASLKLDHVIHGTFSADSPELRHKRFDVICFLDVLEHMTNPEKALTECKSLLADNGVVVASIPNILHFYQIGEILYHQDWRYREEGILDTTHLRFFTKKSILRMFREAGFGKVNVFGINPESGFRFKVANAILLGRISDWKFVQFAVQAREA